MRLLGHPVKRIIAVGATGPRGSGIGMSGWSRKINRARVRGERPKEGRLKGSPGIKSPSGYGGIEVSRETEGGWRVLSPCERAA